MVLVSNNSHEDAKNYYSRNSPQGSRGNYIDPSFPVTCEGTQVLDNIVLNPGFNETYWYRGEPMNSTTFKGLENPFGDINIGNREIMVSDMDLVLSEKMLLSLLN
jgi:hypothetical protein